jgi:SAM-dependent methyltransferase
MNGVTSTLGTRSPAGVPMPSGLAGRLCLALARSCLTGAGAAHAMRTRAPQARFESQSNYLAERAASVDDSRALFAPFTSFADKTVLELGCSYGYMLDTFLQKESFDAIGVDIDPQAIARGRALYGDRIAFHQVTPSAIPLPDESVDVIYSIDTVEHLSQPGETFLECHRILRPGGVCLIQFYPWLSPWGSHLEDIITFPWPHVVFSMDTLLAVAAYLYESDDYVPACYWIDPDTGAPRANPYLDRAHWHAFLNRITIRRFKAELSALPFEVVHFQRTGFGGQTYRGARLLRGLAQIRPFDEFFASVFCVLRKAER